MMKGNMFMKVAVIGIGKMGMLHAGIMNGLKDVELCAISDTSNFLLGAAKSLKKNLAVFDDYKKMLDNGKPDAVVIATPVFLHVPMAEECALRDIPFLMEKPLSNRSKDAEELVTDIEKRNLTTMAGYMMRYVDTFMKAREILKSDSLGRLITFNASIYVSQLFRTGKGWRYSKKESGGGVVISQATHLIDLLQWLFGPVNYVSAHMKSWFSREVEDFAHSFFEFESGLTGALDSSWSVRHHRLMEIVIQVHAENGTLLVSDDCVKLFLDAEAADFPQGWTNLRNPDLFQGVEIDLGGPQYTRQDADFLSAVRKGSKVESDLKNAYYVQRIVDSIYASAEKRGEPVYI
jgi:predicted dehydrogenase